MSINIVFCNRGRQLCGISAEECIEVKVLGGVFLVDPYASGHIMYGNERSASLCARGSYLTQKEQFWERNIYALLYGSNTPWPRIDFWADSSAIQIDKRDKETGCRQHFEYVRIYGKKYK